MFVGIKYLYPMNETTTIFGLRAVMEAIQNNESIDKIYIQKGLSGHLFQELQQHLSSRNTIFHTSPLKSSTSWSRETIRA